jgi:hypothetical protein
MQTQALKWSSRNVVFNLDPRIQDVGDAQEAAFREYLIRAEYARDEALTYGRVA